MNNELKDLYQRVTDQIVKAIEDGAADWKMPWHKTGSENFTPINGFTKKPYRGVNILSLWAAADACGYPTGLWATYKQWQEMGAQVKKGEKATLVVFWKFSDRDTDEDAGAREEREEHAHRGVLARGYSVFNAAQVDGYQPPPVPVIAEAERIEGAEQFFAALGADIRHGGNRAYFSPSIDHIQMPPFGIFKDSISYYAVLAHEGTHWTGGTKRLNRDLSGRFGQESYAAEELIAELGAAFVCADLGLANEPRPDHAAYVASWLKVLKNDKRAIFTAASKAQAAADWMHGHHAEVKAAA